MSIFQIFFILITNILLTNAIKNKNYHNLKIKKSIIVSIIRFYFVNSG